MMDRPTLLKKLDVLLNEAERTEFWGSLEIELRKGRPVLLRRSTTEKLNLEENPNVRRNTEDR